MQIKSGQNLIDILRKKNFNISLNLPKGGG